MWGFLNNNAVEAIKAFVRISSILRKLHSFTLGMKGLSHFLNEGLLEFNILRSNPGPNNIPSGNRGDIQSSSYSL